MNGISEFYIAYVIIWVFLVLPFIFGVGIALIVKVFKFVL